MIPLLQYVARFDRGERFLGLEGEVTRRVGHGALFVGFPSLFVAPSGEKPALPMCWKGTSLSTICRVFVSIFLFGQSVVVDVEGVGFRPGVVVTGRGVVAVYTRISSQAYVYDN